MKSSTRDKVAGKVDKAAGKTKERVGRATRDPAVQDRGTAQTVGGKVRDKLGDVKKVFGK